MEETQMDGLGKMVDEMIQKRMQDQYAKWHSDDPEGKKKMRDEHLQQRSESTRLNSSH